MRIYINIYRVQKSARYHDRLIGHLVRMGAMDWLKGPFKSKPPMEHWSMVSCDDLPLF